MECPYFEAQSRCSCRQESDRLPSHDIEDYCRRSRHVLCPAFNQAETIDLAGIFEDDQAS